MKTDIASITPTKKMLEKLEEVTHTHSTRCKACKDIVEDPDNDRNIERIRWNSQSMNEALMIKNVHESENEGHFCEVFELA